MGNKLQGDAAKKGADMNAWSQEQMGEYNAKLMEEEAGLVARDAAGNRQRLFYNKAADMGSVAAAAGAGGLTGQTVDARSVSVAQAYDIQAADMATAAARKIAELTNNAAMTRWQAKNNAEISRYEGRAAKRAGNVGAIMDGAKIAASFLV